MRKSLVPIALLLVLVFVGLVSAVTYWTGTQTLSQKIEEVATGSLKNSTISIPEIDGAESATFDAAGSPDLDDALIVNILRPKGATLSVNFKNASEISTLYDNYKLEVIASVVPRSSSITAETTVLTVDLSTTTDTVNLDSGGEWEFDYEVTVTAKNVMADTSANAEFTFDIT